MIEALRL